MYTLYTRNPNDPFVWGVENRLKAHVRVLEHPSADPPVLIHIGAVSLRLVGKSNIVAYLDALETEDNK